MIVIYLKRSGLILWPVQIWITEQVFVIHKPDMSVIQILVCSLFQFALVIAAASLPVKSGQNDRNKRHSDAQEVAQLFPERCGIVSGPSRHSK